MFKIQDGRDYFYQWDINRKLIVNDESIKQVHFCNRTGDCSLVCETYKEENQLVVDVPNILLQQDWRIRAYAYDGNATLHEMMIDVKRRSKPDNYVYTETEILNYEYLKERVDQIEENGVSDEVVAKAIEDYLTENDINVDLTGYATEKYVDDAIAGIEIPEVDLSAYYTKSETDKKIGDAIAAIPEVDLTDYAKKTDIPSTAGLATETFVNQKIAEAQLSGGDVNLDGFATEKYVDDAIAAIELTPGPAGKDGADGKDGKDGYTPVKGVDYFDGKDGKDGVDGAPGKDGSDYVLTDADKAEIAGMVEVSGGGDGDDGIYVGEEEPTDDSIIWINPEDDMDDIANIYATKQYVDDAIANIPTSGGGSGSDIDLTDYATKQYVDDAIEAIEIPDVSGFTTMSAVEAKGYQTASDVNAAITNALSGIKTAEEGAY